jgi:tight adherence protein C
MTTVVLIAGLVAALGAFVSVVALRAPTTTDVDLVAARLDAYHGIQRPKVVEQAEEAEPSFAERVLWPAVRGLAGVIGRRTAEATMAQLQRTLTLAGRPLGLQAGEFLAVRYIGMGLGAVAGGLLGLAVDGTVGLMLGAVVVALFAYLLPRVLISTRVKRAQTEIRRSLPDAMDLMSICVEAGLTFEGAMGKVAERYHDRIGVEFGQVLSEIRLGRQRREALADLGERTGVDEVHSFAQAIIQSESMGTGVARVLRLQSEELRRRRRQHAQEQGAKATLKMLFPMVLFIFPALWVALLGPAVLLLLKEF